MEPDRSDGTRAPETETLAALTPSPTRRYLASGMMVVLGIVLIQVAISGWDSSVPSYLALAVLGLASLAVAWRMHRATSNSLHLRSDGIRSSDGTIIAEVNNISRVELGLFAFKPSNGFLIVLKTPMDRAWHPGLWWRLGRRIGIGGVTPRAEGKVMAERLHMLLQKQG